MTQILANNFNLVLFPSPELVVCSFVYFIVLCHMSLDLFSESDKYHVEELSASSCYLFSKSTVYHVGELSATYMYCYLFSKSLGYHVGELYQHHVAMQFMLKLPWTWDLSPTYRCIAENW